MSKPGDVSYTVYYGASEDGYPTSKNFVDQTEAVLWAIDRSKDYRCRPVTVTKHIVIVELTEVFGVQISPLPPPTPKRIEQPPCHCGDPAWGTNGSCGISGCSNVPT